MYKRIVFRQKKRASKFSSALKILDWKKGRRKDLFRLKSILNFLEKRERFAVQTFILTGGVLITQFILEDIRFYIVFILSILSYFLTWWSLKEDVTGNEKYLLFILPTLFTVSLSLFYFLLPQRMIIRIVTTVIFAIGTYAILLLENIYNVSVQRSIQLLRAAQSVGFLITLIIVFLFANIIYSLRLPFWANLLLLDFICFLLAIQSLWSVNLEKKLSLKLVFFALIVGIGVGELAMALSFWPIANASFSLLISATFYVMIGIIQQRLSDRLFLNVIREYIIVFIFTFILTFLTTKWG